MTPPELARISGIAKIPLSFNIASAPLVVGLLAPSAIMRHCNRFALFSVIWPERAAGTRIVHGNSRSASLVILSPQRAADADRLAGDHPGNCVPPLLAISVHHPRHHLIVGPDVRGRNIMIRPYEREYLCCITPCKALQLSPRHILGITPHTALGTPVRKAD